ncbi:MAG: M1 family aminopeptidase [Acidobacteriaceae bacterium]
MKGSTILAVLLLGGSFALGQQAQSPQVLFSGPPKPSASPATAAPRSTITDAERHVVAVAVWDLDVHLTAQQQSLEVHAQVTLRNNGIEPLTEIPLQLSSSLHFETIGLAGKRLPFSTATLNSDADHTGQLIEATIQLPTPLAPAARVTLDVDYGGTIPLTGKRLLAIGAPQANAEASDWDRISADFIGLRGFGNVVWYPVVSVPALLGDGAKLFTEIGRQKFLDQDAVCSLRVTDEFFNQPPNAAILNGHYVPPGPPVSMPTASFPGIITASSGPVHLGFDTPSLFLARRTEINDNGIRVLATDAGSVHAHNYIAAAGMVSQLIGDWLGNKSHSLATILELPEANDDPAETGHLLATPLSADPPAELAPILAHALSHAAFSSPRVWLNEGVASFMENLWIDAAKGRTAAMENLNAGRTTLAIAEPGTPGQGPGQPLLDAISPVYYRTKATYVLWMLREIVGDQNLQSALQAYKPGEDVDQGYFERIVEQASGRDLRWFFDNWVNEDRGLPDLSIAGVYPSPEAHQMFLVAIDIVNNGYAEALVPVTVKGGDAVATSWVHVPAHGRITQRIMFQQSPTEVDVNDGTIPEVQDSIHRKTLVPASP